jgi:hypothetical protein
MSVMYLIAYHRAPDDIPAPDKIRSLLKDLREARQAKSREGLQMIDHNELSVRLYPLPNRRLLVLFLLAFSCQT